MHRAEKRGEGGVRGRGGVGGDRTDYLAAHRRHWRDAELLMDHERLENADQLYGFSAECGLKAVMVALGMKLDDAWRPAERRHRVHVQKLWPEFGRFAADRSAGSYAEALDGHPFRDWSHHDRYAGDGRVSLAALKGHRQGTRQVRSLVTRAGNEGLIWDRAAGGWEGDA